MASTAWEMASRLSYLLWGSMPDAQLRAAAADNALVEASQVRAHAERLMLDPRAHESVAHFHEQWLLLSQIDGAHVPKSAAAYPEFNGDLLAGMRQEADLFVEDAFWNQPTGLSALLLGSSTFANSAVAALYGVTAPSATEFVPVALDPFQRPGLLTRAGLLSLLGHPDGTSPTKRGKFVRTQLLCQPLPPPPPDVNAALPAAVPNQTTRQRVAAHQENPTCAGCHLLLDPIGLGFEQYDGLGRFRALEAGMPVDASGDVSGADFTPSTFNGVRELAEKLAGSDAVRACAATQWFRYAYGRQEGEPDAATLGALGQSLETSGGDLKKLLLELTQTPMFLQFSPGARP